MDLACVALLLDEEKRKISKRHRILVHEMLNKIFQENFQPYIAK